VDWHYLFLINMMSAAGISAIHLTDNVEKTDDYEE